MNHFKGQPMELIVWEEATPQHHPKEYISVLLHLPEQENFGFPSVREGYWVNSLEGYYSPTLEEEVYPDYWANMPKGVYHA